MRAAIALIVLGLAAWLGVPAHAICPTCSCEISTAGIDFGAYNPVNPTPTQASAPIQIACRTHFGEQTIAYSVGLGKGTGSYEARHMMHGPWRLQYNLYSDPAHTTIWGEDGRGYSDVGGSILATPAGSRQSVTVYGEVPAQQNVAPGNYFDILVATVSY